MAFTSTVCLKKYDTDTLQEFILIELSDLTMDDDKISFTTTISGPSLFVVGVPSSTVGVAPTPLLFVPLRCVASVFYSDDLDDYLRGTDIRVTISMDLRREQVNLINKYIVV